MKIFVDIGHPAHVHYFKNLILKPFYKLQILEYTTNSNPQELKRLKRRNNRKIKFLFCFANNI